MPASAPARRRSHSAFGRLVLFLETIKFEHSVFALPFAYAGMVLGATAANVDITLSLVVWITLAMVGARTLAMGLNRVIDAEIDERNPRTAIREIPTGKVSRGQVWLLCAASLVPGVSQVLCQVFIK